MSKYGLRKVRFISPERFPSAGLTVPLLQAHLGRHPDSIYLCLWTRFVTKSVISKKMASTSDSETTSTTVEEKRIRLCEEFSSIAETDVGVAQSYLSVNEWDMEVK